jgi:hypothetical protein
MNCGAAGEWGPGRAPPDGASPVGGAKYLEKILKYVGLWKRGPPTGRRVVVESADRESPEYAD